MSNLRTTLLFLSVMLTSWLSRAQEECEVTTRFDIDQCTQEVFRGSIGWDTSSICDNITLINGSACGARASSTCGKNFRVSVYDQQLFSITMKNTFVSMLQQCCTTCAKCSVVNEVEDTMFISENVLNTSDIIFPVLGDSTVQKLHGFYFLPIYKVPSFVHFSLPKSNEKIIGEVIAACVNLWPFLLICLLFAAISGFVVWVIEYKFNPGDFPRRFYEGIFDGFWWSFISMTTVGFGDKVTKTFIGKIYAVFWILIGITMCSMFTASLTSNIIQAQEPSSISCTGQDMGVLQGRVHDIAAAAEKGGVLHLGSISHTMRGIIELISMLENQTVRGILFDRNTYYHFKSRTQERNYKFVAQKLLKINMVKTEKELAQKTLSCGILVKDFDDFKYFRSYVQNNYLSLRSCNAIRMNLKETQVQRNFTLFDHESSLFVALLIVLVAIVAVMIVIGLMMEGRRYYVGIKGQHKENLRKADAAF